MALAVDKDSAARISGWAFQTLMAFATAMATSACFEGSGRSFPLADARVLVARVRVLKAECSGCNSQLIADHANMAEDTNDGLELVLSLHFFMSSK